MSCQPPNEHDETHEEDESQRQNDAVEYPSELKCWLETTRVILLNRGLLPVH